MDENLDEWHASGHTGSMTDLLSADSATSMANLMSLYQGGQSQSQSYS